jgi:BASS family bile acid:Na+ symporter
MSYRLFALLRHHGTALLAAGLFIGLAFPPLAALLRPILSLFVFLVTITTFLSIDWTALVAHGRRPGLVALIPAWTLLAAPLLVLASARLMGLPASLVQGVVLWAASPPLASAPALAVLLGLDGAFALLAMISSTFLMPLILPPLTLGLIGLRIDIGIAALMTKLGLFVGSAALIAALIRRVVGPAQLQRRDVEIGGLNVLLLHLFAIAVMDGVRTLILAQPRTALLYAVTAFAANVALQSASFFVFYRFGRLPAVTAALVGGNRNMALVFANLGGAVTPELTLFFATVQFPIYVLPAALRSVYRRLAATSPGAMPDP